MATKEKEKPVVNEEKIMKDNLTFAVPKPKTDDSVPRVRIILPRLEDDGSVTVDQYEHVTIANEKGEEHTRILRGEWVDVPVPVFMALKERYGKQI